MKTLFVLLIALSTFGLHGCLLLVAGGAAVVWALGDLLSTGDKVFVVVGILLLSEAVERFSTAASSRAAGKES